MSTLIVSVVTQQPWATREKYDRADSATRATLVAAAQRTFENLGYARTTIDRITEDAGVSRATFYVYFASKQEVFGVVAQQVRDRMVAAQDLGEIDADDVRAVAEATNAAYLDAYTANLAFLTVLEHQSLVDPEMEALWEQFHTRSRERTARYVRRQTERGVLDPAASPDAIARAGGGMVANFAPLVRSEPGLREQAIADLTAMFLRLVGLDDRA
ncbi:transcriptional regulator, TetR family [Prauserella alba]|nr:transcriptional regulator, TetR family [Prauserella alba]